MSIRTVIIQVHNFRIIMKITVIQALSLLIIPVSAVPTELQPTVEYSQFAVNRQTPISAVLVYPRTDWFSVT